MESKPPDATKPLEGYESLTNYTRSHGLAYGGFLSSSGTQLRLQLANQLLAGEDFLLQGGN